MGKKILRINGQDVELSGSGGGATMGVLDVTDYMVRYCEENGSFSSLEELLYSYMGTIEEFGYSSADDLIRNAYRITLFLDYAKVSKIMNESFEPESGIYITFPLFMFFGELLFIYNRSAIQIMQNEDFANFDFDSYLGEEVLYMVFIADIIFLIGNTKVRCANPEIFNQ